MILGPEDSAQTAATHSPCIFGPLSIAHSDCATCTHLHLEQSPARPPAQPAAQYPFPMSEPRAPHAPCDSPQASSPDIARWRSENEPAPAPQPPEQAPPPETPAPAPAAPAATAVAESVRPRVDHLPPWRVLLHNDDVNDAADVVESLTMLTPLPRRRAVEVMMEAHTKGLALVMITHRERAELYRDQLQSRRLTVTIEPAD